MKMSSVMLVLVLAVAAVAQENPQQPGQPGTAGASAGQAAPAQQQKTIKDPAEYNAYVNAIQAADPNARTVALEGFLQQYPNSVVKEDALELLMSLYSTPPTANAEKAVDAANRLLQVNPNSLRALALMAHIKRQTANTQPPQQAVQTLKEAQQYALRGLQLLPNATKPENLSDAQFQSFKTGAAAVFNGAAGIAALQTKSYADAQKYLGEAVKLNPDNLPDVYPYALSLLQAPAPDQKIVDGLWYVARAFNIAGKDPRTQAAQSDINKYGRSQYIKYHGNDEGWQQVIQMAAASPVPPADFTITPRPTPAQEAAQLVQSKKISDMSFDEFQLIFTSGNQQAAETVWSQIKEKPIAFAAQVVEATPTRLTLSATAEDIEKKIPDVTLNMVAPIPAKLMPKPGAMTQVQGDPVSFTAQPFMITMGNGTLIGAKPAESTAPAKTAKPGAKKPAAKKR